MLDSDRSVLDSDRIWLCFGYTTGAAWDVTGAAWGPFGDGPLCVPPAPWPKEPEAAHITPRLAMRSAFTGRHSRPGAWYNALGAYHGAMSPQGTDDNAPKFGGPGLPGGRGGQGTGPQGQQPGPGPGPGTTPPTGDRSWKFVLAAVIVLLIVFLSVPSLLSKPSATSLGWSQFLQKVNTHQVSTAEVDNTTGIVTGKLDNGQNYTTDGPHPAFSSDVANMEAKGVTVTFGNSSPSELVNILIYVLPIVLIIGFAWFFLRRTQAGMSGIMSIGRSRARLYSTERPRTTFADVAGYSGVKLEISEVVDFLKSPGRFKEIGARIPKGVLLVGPPGTGKTLLARAVAGEAGVPFMSVSGSDFMEMFVGVGASRVRDLFQTPASRRPAIIFVDEIDSIGRKRGAGLGGGHDEREQTLNQMLSEMDGFDPAEGVVMIAATNRPDILDPALLRPGRFDRQIVVPLPDLEERLPILQVHCKDKRIGPDVDLELVARGTPGMSGADLANLVNEAALYAVRRGCQAGRDARLRRVARPSAHGPAAGEPGPVGVARRSESPTTRAATPCWPTCCPTQIRSTRSRSSRPACPSE